ncbi:MAG: histidine triad nucleotide-binding protein [bacterium (Candidatus Stahlbacteria) CG23_combo_of_CG06-09_8_20_14_all_34_7]|nr:MAG: histidine triad nucleotide-binding protein [bacterium (Candidatus Stahlbacteria) CG23_combo_of_CG06-09_8_20_14_all_34_7]
MNECIFCKIAKKEINAKIVYEDKDILAFDDISPQAPVHVIIISKKHIVSVDSLISEEREIITALLLSFKKIAEIKNVSSDGYRIVSNHKERAGQSVFHLHFHLLGGRDMKWPPG